MSKKKNKRLSAIKNKAKDLLEKLGRIRIPSFKHLFAYFLYIISLVGIFLAVSLLFVNSLDIRPRDEFRGSSKITTPYPGNDSSYSTAKENTCQANQCAIVTIEFQNIDPINLRTHGTLTIEVPNVLLKSLWANNEYIVKTDPTSPEILVLDNDYSNLIVGFYIQDDIGIEENTKVINIPLESFFEGDPKNGYIKITYPFDFKVFGETYLYPSNYYLYYNNVSIQLPGPVWIHSNSSNLSLIPFDLRIKSNSNMSGYTLRFINENTSFGYFHKTNVMIVRDFQTITYVYGMSLLPTLLGFVLWYDLFKKVPRRDPRSNLILEVSAIIFTILPLRSILIPQEMTGLVRVDYLLGFGVVIVISVAFCRYGKDLLTE